MNNLQPKACKKENILGSYTEFIFVTSGQQAVFNDLLLSISC